MAQPRRERRIQVSTQPYIMPDERRPPGRAPAGEVADRPVRRRNARPPGRTKPESRPDGYRRAAPERRIPRSRPLQRPGRKGRARGAPLGRRRLNIDARRWRIFTVLVVVPVLLMLGSIYTHAAADGISSKVSGLEQSQEAAKVRQEKLGLKLAGLTAPERIRSKARDLGLREPIGNMKVYGSHGEDGTNAARKTGEGKSR